VSETLFVDQWLYDTFRNDSALNNAVGGRFYVDVIPENASYPNVVFTMSSANDVFGQGTFRIMNRATYHVKVVGQTRSYWEIDPIYRMVDDLLQGKGGDTANAHIFSCMRYSEFRLAEFTNGRDYRHLGGLYQIEMQRI
jgi:hypothetical protein